MTILLENCWTGILLGPIYRKLFDWFFKSNCPGSSGVEQRTENPRVGGSNPPPGTINYFGKVI